MEIPLILDIKCVCVHFCLVVELVYRSPWNTRRSDSGYFVLPKICVKIISAIVEAGDHVMIFRRDPVQLNFTACSILIVFRYYSHINVHSSARKRSIGHLHFHVLVEFLEGFLIIYIGPQFDQEFTDVG